MAKYPNIHVKLTGQDDSVLNLLKITLRELKKNNVPAEEITQFFEEATSGSYDNLLVTIAIWVKIS